MKCFHPETNARIGDVQAVVCEDAMEDNLGILEIGAASTWDTIQTEMLELSDVSVSSDDD